MNQRQQQIIEFQNAQIEALLKKFGKKRLLLDDNQRRRLAVKAHAIGRKARKYVQHYHAERNHQGLGNELIEPSEDAAIIAGMIECRERLGGMLKYYHRSAA